MGRKQFVAVKDQPYFITARNNNREDFPLPLEVMWSIFSDYLFLLHEGFQFKIHAFILMVNHLHLLVSDPEGKLSKGMQCFMKETSL
jgi:putative transposase